MSLPAHHAWTHRPRFLGGTDPAVPLGYYEIKVFADRGALDGNLPDEAIVVSTGDGKFVFAIPEDIDQSELVHAAAFVSEAGAVTVQVRNVTQAANILTTAITVDSGEFSSYTAAAPPVIDDTHIVEKGDLVAIDVDAADGTAEGLGVILQFAVR